MSAPPTVLDDQMASAAVSIYWLLMWIWMVIAECSYCGVCVPAISHLGGIAMQNGELEK